jgi:transcriptional regulator with XRE-family HTH domain
MPKIPAIPSHIDVAVGTRLRTRRKLLGMSQTSLADQLDITFQQVQKYEKGTNRIGSSRLQQIANILGTTPAWLFGEEEENRHGAVGSSAIEDMIGTAEGIALNQAFIRIKDAGVRRSLIALVKTLASNDDE